uniref:Uncharacterized protein n=1 Tax=Siphoviridae sp. ctkTc5 TaxID=2827922 RepID=A0A8S5SKS0_9CAUD|nr:MAG TPA: hypothetical protein [Siphoviridae sp. ctkTc5]
MENINNFSNLHFYQSESLNLGFVQECHEFFHFKNLPPYFDTWA